MEQIKGSDFIYLSDNSLYGFYSRYKEYGASGILNVKKPSKLGVVCEYNGHKVAVLFGSKVEVKPLTDVISHVKAVYRNSGYYNEFASLDMQDSSMAIFANPDQYKILKKEINGNIGATVVYVLTSSRVRYPIHFANFDFKIDELMNGNNGFSRVL